MGKTKRNSLKRITIASILAIALIVTMIPAIGQIVSSSSSELSYKVENALFVDAASKKITVKFYGNKGEIKKKSKKVTKGKKYGTLPKATRKGHYFQGWYTKKSGGKKVTKSTKLNSKKTVKLYAHWSRIPAKYKNNIGKTLGAMKKKDKNFKYLVYYFYEDAAASMYGTSKSKVRYVNNVGQSTTGEVPKKYRNDFSVIKNIRIVGLEGEIFNIFPGVKKNMPYKDFLKYLGVKNYNFYPAMDPWSSGLFFQYQGFNCSLSWTDGNNRDGKFIPPTIKPNQHITLTVQKDTWRKSNEKICEKLWKSAG